MSTPNPADPSISAQQLAELAGTDPSTWPAILQNPNCYPELRDWIQSQMATQMPSVSETTEIYTDADSGATTQYFETQVSEGYAAQQTGVLPAQQAGANSFGPQYAAPSGPYEAAQKKSSSWIWWLIGGVVVVAAIVIGLFAWSPWSNGDAADEEVVVEETVTTEEDPAPNSDSKEESAPSEENEAPVAPVASADEFCSIMQDANTNISMDDPDMIAKTARVFTEAAAVAPAEIKADVDQIAEYMTYVGSLDMSDPSSMDMDDLEWLSEQTAIVTESSTKLTEWVTTNCWK